MITLSFQLWELAVLIIAIAICIGTHHLVKTLKNLTITLDDVNKLLDAKNGEINNIIDNADTITEEAKTMLTDAHATVDKVSDSVVTPLVDNVGKVVNVVSKFNSAAGRREQKLERRTKKAKRKAA